MRQTVAVSERIDMASGEGGMDQALLAPTCHATKAATAIILHTPVYKP